MKVIPVSIGVIMFVGVVGTVSLVHGRGGAGGGGGQHGGASAGGQHSSGGQPPGGGRQAASSQPPVAYHAPSFSQPQSTPRSIVEQVQRGNTPGGMQRPVGNVAPVHQAPALVNGAQTFAGPSGVGRPIAGLSNQSHTVNRPIANQAAAVGNWPNGGNPMGASAGNNNGLRNGNGAVNGNHVWYHGPWNNHGYASGGAGPGFNNGYGGYGYGNGYGGYGNGFGYGGYGGFGGGLLGIGLALGGLGGGYGGYGGGYGGYGGGYGGYPLGWGIGNLAYNSGYSQYSNPYYTGGAGGYNYSQTLPFLASGGGAINPQGLDSAIERFKAGDYATALTLVDTAIQAQPSDAVLHEFRALVLFAIQDYAQAAATIHTVLAQGPGWDWTTLSSLYPDVNIYTAQLRALEEYTKSNPNEADGRFLLAYHYMTTGHPEAAATQLQAVAHLAPTDHLAAELLTMVGGSNAAQGSPTNPAPTQPATQQAEAQPAPEMTTIDPAALVGDWHASRSDGSKFEFNLLPDHTYAWNFKLQQRDERFSGTYTVDHAVLALQRKEGGAMLGQVAFDGTDRFNFKLLGARPEDTGLTFSR